MSRAAKRTEKQLADLIAWYRRELILTATSSNASEYFGLRFKEDED